MTAKTKGKIALLFLDDGPLILPIGLARRMTDRQLREALWLNLIELKEICGEEIADLAPKPIRELTRAEMLDIVAKHQHLFNPDTGTADNVRPVHASADMGAARRTLPPYCGLDTSERVRATLQYRADLESAGCAGAQGPARAGDVAVGLIPFWAGDAKIAYKTINARTETIAKTPAFREAWKTRRCLIPTSGFYEWLKTPHGKQPYLIGIRDQRPFSLGGLWESWRDRASGEKIETYTIITTAPNKVAGKIHNRMPLIIDPADFDRWLTAIAPPADLLRPC